MVTATLAMAVYTDPAHAILVDLPNPGAPGDLGPLTPVGNQISIDRGGNLFWNSQAVNPAEFARILDQSKTKSPQPALWFEPDGDASYGSAVTVLAMLRSRQLLDHCFRFSNVSLYRRYENLRPSTLHYYQKRDCEPLSGH